MPWHSFCHNCEFERNCRYFPSLKIWLVPLFCYCSTVYSFFFFLLNYFKARNFSGLKILWFRGWNLKSAKLKCHQHTAKLKCRKIKSLGQNIKLKCRKKNLLKNSYVKKQCYKNAFLCLASLKLCKIELIFQKQGFYMWMEGKPDLTASNNPNGENHEEHCSEIRINIFWYRFVCFFFFCLFFSFVCFFFNIETSRQN